jgi:hypothetical protein
MSNTPTVFRGVIHGRFIELEAEAGLADGEAVAVTLQSLQEPGGRLAPGEGIRRSAGGWADDAAELDEYLAWNRERRKIGRREIPE